MKKISLNVIMFLVSATLCFAGSTFDFKKYDSSVLLCVVPVRDVSGEVVPAIGTVFTVTKEGHAITNAHVVEEAIDSDSIAVCHLVNGVVKNYKIRIIAINKDLDLAIIKIKGINNVKAIPFYIKQPDRTDNVVAMGFPGTNTFAAVNEAEGVTPSIQHGRIESVKELSNWGLNKNFTAKVILHNTDIRGGNSGGPLFNDRGEIIGVNTSGEKGNLVENAVSRSLHADEVMSYLKLYNISFTRGVEGSKLKYIIIILVGGILMGLICMVVYMARRSALYVSASKVSSYPAADNAPSGNAFALKDIKIELVDGSGKLLKYRVTAQLMKKHGTTVSIGRGDSAFVKIPNTSISRTHCSVIMNNNELYMRDENSSNGTYVDGNRIQPGTSVKISPSSRITMGELSGRIFTI